MSVRSEAVAGPRPKLTARAAGLLVAMTVLALVAIGPAREYLGERARVTELQRKAAQLEVENADLRAQIDELYQPTELERLARECLGMVRPGEIALVIVPKDGKPRPPASC